ncbi:MAG: hypothetical protein K2I11_07165, partial [Bacteroides sp.]|nr:hypothetical protein [Bacteroides sp.]
CGWCMQQTGCSVCQLGISAQGTTGKDYSKKQLKFHQSKQYFLFLGNWSEFLSNFRFLISDFKLRAIVANL